jgi:translocation and assembly module TamA
MKKGDVILIGRDIAKTSTRKAGTRWPDYARYTLSVSASAAALLLGTQAHAGVQADAPASTSPASIDNAAAAQGDGNPSSTSDAAANPPHDSRDIAAPSPPPPDVLFPIIEPIIEDDEFRKAIPPITAEDDPELSRPLESIAEFEQRQDDEAAERLARRKDAKSNGDNLVSQNDAADSDTDIAAAQPNAGQVQAPLMVPVIGSAPIRDTELSAPLPPLDSFDVTPVEFAEAADDSRNRQVRYSIKINGMSEAESSSEISMGRLFRSLSALHDGDGKADNIAMLRARLTADGELVQRIMASEGYYDAAVNTRIVRAGADDPLAATLDVTAGTRYNFSEIRVEAGPTIPDDLIATNFPLRVGEPIVAERDLAAEAAIALRLPEHGYPFTKVGQRDILLDGAAGTGAYTLPVEVGNRARFGGITTSGDLAFDAEHVELLARFKQGDLYDSRKVDDLRQALVATGLLSTVAAETQPTGRYAEDGSEYVTMAVTQQAGPPRTLAGSIGYGTGQGLRAEGSWQHRNLFPPEGALIVRGLAGTQEQSLGVTMRRSNAGRRDRSFEVVAEALRSNYDAFEAITGRLGFRISRESTPLWQKKLTYSFGADLIATREDDYDFANQSRRKDFYTILGLTGQLGVDRSNSMLDPTKGFRITALLQPEGSLAGSFTPYARTQIDGSAYYPVMDNLVIAGRVRVASILGAERERLAPSRRFYGGGGGSVRGFGYQQLGPKDPNNDPIGGRSLNEVGLEARYRFGSYGVVGFVDAGQVYTSSTPDFSHMRVGVGLGGRFYTNFGPMRLDVATPIGRKPGESRVSVYVSIGQAF